MGESLPETLRRRNTCRLDRRLLDVLAQFPSRRQTGSKSVYSTLRRHSGGILGNTFLREGGGPREIASASRQILPLSRSRFCRKTLLVVGSSFRTPITCICPENDKCLFSLQMMVGFPVRMKVHLQGRMQLQCQPWGSKNQGVRGGGG